ncbi:MAG: hypothetical protein MK066_00700 [Crocinitomicaceae bacterium]|nr:hypothetical protein [Crocinitomicaceae bacterium]
MQNYFSESEKNVSFPIWFNDSIIRVNEIKKMTRRTFELNQDTSGVNFPMEVKTYSFDKEGDLSSYQIVQYYENTEVGSVTFYYSNVKDKNGYTDIKKITSTTNDMESFYTVHHKERYTDNFAAYRNEQNGNYLLCMLNKVHFGALSVDSILNPTPSDVVLLGNPRVPQKIYQVENRVREFNVTNMSYDGKTNLIETVDFEKTPFSLKREFLVNADGRCKGFVDSTFTIDKFIFARTSTFDLNKNNLPIRLTHVSSAKGKQGENVQLETFEYEKHH